MRMPLHAGSRSLVEAVCERIGLDVVHVDPKKTGTVSNLAACKDKGQPNWMSLQSESYFLRKSATGMLGCPVLLQKLGVRDGKSRRVRWDHSSQTLEVTSRAFLGEAARTGEIPTCPSQSQGSSLGLDMKEGFHKMDRVCSESLRKSFREIVVRHTLHLKEN